MNSSSVLLLASIDLCSSVTCRSPRLDYGLRSLQKASPVCHHPSLAVRSSGVSDKVAKPSVARRSANYKDYVWDYDYIQYSMRNGYVDLKYKMEAEELKQRVGLMLHCVSDWGEQLELIDDLQRLGVAYQFDKEIQTILNKVYCKNYVHDKHWVETDLRTTAVAFRLLRQHGHSVPQGMKLNILLRIIRIGKPLNLLRFLADIFRSFLDDTGRFKSVLCEDFKGLISLYEASYLSLEGEVIMEEVLIFTTANLSKPNKATDEYLDVLLVRALDMPLHLRTARSEARWVIEEAYEKKPSMSSLMLQFPKLDFNIVQSLYLDELKDVSTHAKMFININIVLTLRSQTSSYLAGFLFETDLYRWWKALRFEDLSFARDCLVVSYVWGIMASSKPQYAACRRAFAKIIA